MKYDIFVCYVSIFIPCERRVQPGGQCCQCEKWNFAGAVIDTQLLRVDYYTVPHHAETVTNKL